MIPFTNYCLVILRYMLKDIRLAQDPFPLYPGEILKQAVSPLRVVTANSAIRLHAILDFESDSGEKRIAGDEWLFEGPGNFKCYQSLSGVAVFSYFSYKFVINLVI